MGVRSALRIAGIFKLRVTKNGHDSFSGTMSTNNYSASRAVSISGTTEIIEVLSLFSETSESRGRNSCISKYNRRRNMHQLRASE